MMINENSRTIKSCRSLMAFLLALGIGLYGHASAFAQQNEESTPVDLTKLVRTAPDNTSSEEEESSSAEDSDINIAIKTITAEDTDNISSASNNDPSEEPSSDETTAASPILTSSTSISVSSSLTKKDPSSIRLGSLGLDRDDLDGLGRLMWEGSDAATALALMSSLDPGQTPAILRPVIDHIMVARSVPPEGFIDIASDIINVKLNWMASTGASDDLASMIRQLPDTSTWDDPKAWLVMHDLMTRNDNDACQTAQKKVLVTLDTLWHQVNAFCAVIAGEDMQAAFALDILQDSGVDDQVYFELMRKLTDGNDVVIEDQMDLSILNIVLMDSARLSINADAITALPQSYSQTAGSLRYLDPTASRLIGARSFDQHGSDVAQSWSLLPRDELSSAEALTRLRFGGDDDTLAMARLNAWHAISAEKDEMTAASLAFEALIADYNHSGIASLGLWLPLIEGGVNSDAIDAKIGPLMGLVSDPSRVLLNDEAMAWHNILTVTSRPVSQDSLMMTAAFDAIPLIEATGRPVADIDWEDIDSISPSLSSGTSLPYAALKHIEKAAEQGQKAELVLRLATLLQGHSYTDLNRDDAAVIIGALVQVGLKDTAQNLARDILITWSADRHIKSLAGTAQGS